MPHTLRVYFVRHGESAANLRRVFDNRGEGLPLTEKGQEQARALADRLRERIPTGQRVAIYTSPLRRARQTAEALGQAFGTCCVVDEALREYDTGINEGQTGPDAWARYTQAREDWFTRGLYDSHIEGGESLTEIHARFMPFFQRLVEDPSIDDLILVSHGGLYACVLPAILANIDQEFADRGMANAGYVLAEQREALVCLEWCGEKVASEN